MVALERVVSLASWSVRGAGWFCLWALDLVELFKFIAYLTGLNSNPSGSSDLWVAARPSGVPGGRPGGWVVTVVASILARSECVAAVAECACFKRACCFARATIGFVVGLRVRVGVSRRLREPTCGVAFTGAELWSAEPVEGVLALLAIPFLWVYLGDAGQGVVPLTVCLAMFSRLRWWDFVCPQGRKVGFVSRALRALPYDGLKRLVVKVSFLCFPLVARGGGAGMAFDALSHTVVTFVAKVPPLMLS
ncbi:hypothetical protein Taro_005784 [Colocasia esculenta]|uniref:Uncharacterized protein n=1 Tax=Colocasia esculenta TaxID=4460 RepID=A0A843TQT7_COLES|nr:hypothetical protein [Colocasia esculenta]